MPADGWRNPFEPPPPCVAPSQQLGREAAATTCRPALPTRLQVPRLPTPTASRRCSATSSLATAILRVPFSPTPPAPLTVDLRQAPAPATSGTPTRRPNRPPPTTCPRTASAPTFTPTGEWTGCPPEVPPGIVAAVAPGASAARQRRAVAPRHGAGSGLPPPGADAAPARSGQRAPAPAPRLGRGRTPCRLLARRAPRGPRSRPRGACALTAGSQ